MNALKSEIEVLFGSPATFTLWQTEHALMKQLNRDLKGLGGMINNVMLQGLVAAAVKNAMQ